MGDIPGHQVRILEIHHTYNDQSRLAVSNIRVKESWTRGYSDYVRGVGRAWGYTIWMLDDGNQVFVEYSGTADTRPIGGGAIEGTYHGASRLTGGTGKFKGIRGALTDFVEFNTSTDNGYNRGNSRGEYWFVE